jgi:hypothetical protein
MQAREKKSEILVDLQGQIERVTYTNDENGYTSPNFPSFLAHE